MRFYNYINEITQVSDEEVREILDTGFDMFYKEVKKSAIKFYPILLGKLNIVFNPLEVSFVPKFLFKGTEAVTNLDSGDIVIPITRKKLKNLKNKKSIEEYKEELFKVLAHELTHKKQFAKMGQKAKQQMKKSIQSQNTLEYFTDYHEIEAYAKQAASELQNGEKSEILQTYWSYVRPNDEKAWKKFLTDLYKYLSKNTDDLQRLVDQLKTRYKDDKFNKAMSSFEDSLEKADRLMKQWRYKSNNR